MHTPGMDTAKYMKERSLRMIKFMDGIVEAVDEFAKAIAGGVVYSLGLLVKGFILITAPAWILPYKVTR